MEIDGECVWCVCVCARDPLAHSSEVWGSSRIRNFTLRGEVVVFAFELCEFEKVLRIRDQIEPRILIDQIGRQDGKGC